MSKIEENMPQMDTKQLAAAYRAGFAHGRVIVQQNIPTLGSTVSLGDRGDVIVDRTNIREVHASLCASEGAKGRDGFFEMIPNEKPERQATADELWAAFEAGTNAAITADLASYSDADYGI